MKVQLLFLSFLTAVVILSVSAHADTNTLSVGDMAPDFSLVNQTNGVTKLSDYRGKRNVVITFTRAHW